MAFVMVHVAQWETPVFNTKNLYFFTKKQQKTKIMQLRVFTNGKKGDRINSCMNTQIMCVL
jgi:hypothetical protein